MPHIRNFALLIVITGVLAIALGVFPKAVLASAPIDKKKVEEAQAFFENGVDAFNAKKYDDARKYFSNAVSCNPEYAEAYAKLGDTLEALKEEEPAYENYQRCIELINNMVSSTPAQTTLLDEVIKKTAKFRAFEEKINNLNKDLVAKLLELSKQCIADTDYAMAKEIFSLILQIEEKNEEATQGLQKMREEIEKRKTEEEESGKAEDNQLAESFYKTGLTQMEQKDYETAITKFKKAIAYRPEYPEALFKLGEAYEKNKQPKESVNPYRECRRILTGKPQRTKEEEQLLSQVLRRLDQLDTNGKQMIKVKSNWSLELLKLANQCITKKYINFAVRILNRILDIDSANKSAQELLTKLGKPKTTQAKSDKSKPSAADIVAAEKYYDSANQKYEQGKFDEAIADYTEAIRLAPDNAKIYIDRGSAYYKNGEAEQAIKDYDKAIELNPNIALVYNNRGVIYHKRGEIDRAFKDYNKAIELDPNNADAYGNRGNVYAAKKDYKRAIADVEWFLKLVPNHPQAEKMRGLIEEWRSKLK